MSDAIEISSPTTVRALLTQDALKVEFEQRALLGQYIRNQMVEGTDFGKIPGTEKPTLLKPGAEKLVDLFRCTPKFALIKVEEDFERGFFNYIFRVRLYQRDADAVLAEGFGSANSREGRYRWREAQRKCPKCQKATIFSSKHAAEFYCWAKKGGCGAKFKADDTSITGQQAGRVENDDVATLANTILKMAKKRALVDGAIALARCSDMFTQDVEDMAEGPQEPEPPPQGGAKPAASAPAAPATSRTQQVKEKLRRGTVVDQRDGETEEQAKARTAKEQASAAPAPWEQLEIYCRENGFTIEAGWNVLRVLQEKKLVSGKLAKKADLDAPTLTLMLGELAKVREAKERVERQLGQPMTTEHLEEAPF